jgi:hypothetical protein
MTSGAYVLQSGVRHLQPDILVASRSKGELMLRARVRLGLLTTGLVILLVEFGFALYSSVHLYLQMQMIHTFQTSGLRIVGHLPAALLALATVIGGVAVWRAWRGRFHRTSCFAALTPVVALLAGYPSSISPGVLLHVRAAGLPWAAPIWWKGRQTGLPSLLLIIALYLAALLYLAEALPWPARGRQSGSSLLQVHGPNVR